MTCARCGSTDVSVRKSDDYFCARCAVATDWEAIISIAQNGPVLEASIEFEIETVGAPADPFAS